MTDPTVRQPIVPEPAEQPIDAPSAVQWEAPPEVAGPAPGIEFAGHGARLVAYIIDSLILSAIMIVLYVVAAIILFGGMELAFDPVTGDVDVESVQWSGGGIVFFFAVGLVSIVLAIFYFPWFWARGGQTPGMRPFGLVVVRDVDGGRIGWGAAILRTIGMYVASLVLYIGFIWVFIDKRRRGWHDLIAGTVVIKRP